MQVVGDNAMQAHNKVYALAETIEALEIGPRQLLRAYLTISWSGVGGLHHT